MHLGDAQGGLHDLRIPQLCALTATNYTKKRGIERGQAHRNRPMFGENRREELSSSFTGCPLVVSLKVYDILAKISILG